MLNKEYWNNSYLQNKTGWDIGYCSPPLQAYFRQIENKKLDILVPGAGNAYEVEFLYQAGFQQVYLLDFAEKAIKNFHEKNPYFPENQLLNEDFFHHQRQYDLIVELAFLSTFPKKHREKYVKKMHRLLKTGGKLVGVIFNHEFDFEGPPYGGTNEEYHRLFSKYFDIIYLETAHNSIKPRATRESFILLKKRPIFVGEPIF